MPSTDRVVWPWHPEHFTIGPEDCPIMYRLTLFRHPRVGSLRIHRFQANADDRDVHDHPWSFVTFVLRGWYDDMRPCGFCDGGFKRWTDPPRTINGVRYGTAFSMVMCMTCQGQGVVVRERMTPGKVRHRSADHAHRTRVGPQGCTTLCVTGPVTRRWGFWRDRRWIWWRDYERVHGHGMACDDDGQARRDVRAYPGD